MTAPLSLLALSPPKIDYLSILPVLVMLGGAVAILAVSSVLRRRADATWVTVMAVMTALAALSLSLVQWFDVANHGAHVSIDSAVVEDPEPNTRDGVANSGIELVASREMGNLGKHLAANLARGGFDQQS